MKGNIECIDNYIKERIKIDENIYMNLKIFFSVFICKWNRKRKWPESNNEKYLPYFQSWYLESYGRKNIAPERTARKPVWFRKLSVFKKNRKVKGMLREDTKNKED